MGPDMTEEELVEALKYYGDHKDHCGITKVIRSDRPPTDSDGYRIYPPCNCGWQDIAKKLSANGADH